MASDSTPFQLGSQDSDHTAVVTSSPAHSTFLMPHTARGLADKDALQRRYTVGGLLIQMGSLRLTQQKTNLRRIVIKSQNDTLAVSCMYT